MEEGLSSAALYPSSSLDLPSSTLCSLSTSLRLLSKKNNHGPRMKVVCSMLDAIEIAGPRSRNKCYIGIMSETQMEWEKEMERKEMQTPSRNHSCNLNDECVPEETSERYLSSTLPHRLEVYIECIHQDLDERDCNLSQCDGTINEMKRPRFVF